MVLTEKAVTTLDPADKQWLVREAERLDRSEAAVLRIAFRQYRDKVTRTGRNR